MRFSPIPHRQGKAFRRYVAAGLRFRRVLLFVAGLALVTAAGVPPTGCVGPETAGEPDLRPLIDVGDCSAADAGDPALERYGTSCVCCHQRTFGVAGSVAHDSGVETVLVVDRDGKTADMAPNPHENFFQHRRLTPPLAAVVVFADGERRTMRGLAPHGSCNACHGVTVPRVGAR